MIMTPKEDQIWYNQKSKEFVKIASVRNDCVYVLEKDKKSKDSYNKVSNFFYKLPEFLEWFTFHSEDKNINDLIKFKEEARQAYKDQQSQDNEGGCGEPIGFVYGYIEACKKYNNELNETKNELEKLRECLKNIKEFLGGLE